MSADIIARLLWLAQSALNGFEDLDIVDALDGASSDFAEIMQVMERL